MREKHSSGYEAWQLMARGPSTGFIVLVFCRCYFALHRHKMTQRCMLKKSSRFVIALH